MLEYPTDTPPTNQRDRIIIHLNRSASCKDEYSDAYREETHLGVALSPAGVVRLMCGRETDGSLCESLVSERQYRLPMTMASKRLSPWKDTKLLMEYLSHCLQDAENSVASMTFDKVTLSVYGCHGDGEDQVDVRPRILPAFQARRSSPRRHGNRRMSTERGKRMMIFIRLLFDE